MKRLYLLLLSGLLLRRASRRSFLSCRRAKNFHGGRHPLRWREGPVQTVAGTRGARRQTRPNGTAENRVGTYPPIRMLFSGRFGQVARLEALDLITSYNPVGEEGRPIPEPDEDSQGEILPLYSVVPIGFQFPEDIPYTKIYDVYIQSLGGAGSASGSEEQLSTDLFKDVLTQTLAATGHTSVATRAGESQQEWNLRQDSGFTSM